MRDFQQNNRLLCYGNQCSFLHDTEILIVLVKLYNTVMGRPASLSQVKLLPPIIEPVVGRCRASCLWQVIAGNHAVYSVWKIGRYLVTRAPQG